MVKQQDNKDRIIIVSPPNCNVGKTATKKYDSLTDPDDLLIELAELLSAIDDNSNG